ncbi:hypothetical protein AJ79_04970 [Helicocarpus griseus UAMH5409]|uniref:Uncharacterized protein n=1 Tax=Helicocarpus griseus UAMH5409 TaxID=1447875 RepID=A0A2B7XQK9_9EURO|nr:hypothetical protein AJ79_04970 [Helicocarpus griseus UAMH5409]
MAPKRKKPGRKKKTVASSETSRQFLNKRERLLRRFYEPLVLLHTLGDVGGSRTNPASSSSSPSPTDNSNNSDIRGFRRGFLDELAYVCDYDTGADTVTAIGLESASHGCVFWVASNTPPAAKLIPFLKILLQTLRRAAIASVPYEKDAEDIAKLCITFGARRIKRYRSLLSRELEGCAEYFETNKESLQDLEQWLRRFCTPDPNDLVSICQFAFETGNSQEKQLLYQLSQEPSYRTNKDAIHHKFSKLHHYISRLAQHIHAANTLVSTAPNLTHLLDSYSIRAIPTPSRAEWLPPIDEAAVRNKTLLDKVLVRMLPAKSPELGFYQQELRRMDETTQLSYRFLRPYTDPTIRPRVHAEIQVLEHFYSKGLCFEGSDRYIACSKPACYCCRLYFRHHPGNFEEPVSGGKIYLNWRPPDVSVITEFGGVDANANPAQGDNDKQNQTLQRDILNAMIRDIRKDALREIIGKQDLSTYAGSASTAAERWPSTGVERKWNGVTGGERDGLAIDAFPFPPAKGPSSTIASQPQFNKRHDSCSTATAPFSAGSMDSSLASVPGSFNSDEDVEEEDFDDDGGVPLYG